MKLIHSLFLMITASTIAGQTPALEPAYREIQATLTYGPLIPGDDQKTQMKAGSGITLELGVALSPRFIAGFRGSIDTLEPEPQTAPLFEDLYGDNNWIRSTASAYGEYSFSHDRLSPFLDANIGIHGFDISYVRLDSGYDGGGDYGIGYGLCAGVRYRNSRRFGGVIRLDAENASGVGLGWFYSVRGGVSVFM